VGTSNLFQPPSEAEIGMKVSIRLFEEGGGFRDLLGVLITPTRVQKKNLEIIEFNPNQIFLWKIVKN
jgi:hypothetical protein